MSVKSGNSFVAAFIYIVDRGGHYGNISMCVHRPISPDKYLVQFASKVQFASNLVIKQIPQSYDSKSTLLRKLAKNANSK
jgi:hypothetical protein